MRGNIVPLYRALPAQCGGDLVVSVIGRSEVRPDWSAVSLAMLNSPRICRCRWIEMRGSEETGWRLPGNWAKVEQDAGGRVAQRRGVTAPLIENL